MARALDWRARQRQERNSVEFQIRGTLGAMQITVQLPDDLAQRPDAAREALEAFAIEGYRSGALSAYQTRMLLGFETRYELDGFLKEHGVWERAYRVRTWRRTPRHLNGRHDRCCRYLAAELSGAD